MKNKRVIKEAKNILLIVIGVLLMGFAFNSFFYSNSIAPGGFSGLAAVISDLIFKLTSFYITPTLLYLFFNLFLIFFAYKTLGFKYFIYSLFGIATFSLCIEFLNINIYLNDLFLSSIFGAVLMGVGTGLVVVGGGSTGGGEMLGNILHKFNNELTVGKVTIIVNSVVILLSLATYGLVLSLYSLIAIYLAGIITDKVIEGGKGTKAYYIISEKHEEIANAILNKLYRGATLIDGKGVYSKQDKQILMCLLNKYEARNLKNIVFEIDDKAFLFSTSVTEAYGLGFNKQVKYTKLFNFKKKNNKKIENKVKTLSETNTKIDKEKSNKKISKNKKV